MARNREEDEMIGSIPEHGEDPRFADGDGVIVSSNGAFSEIEDLDHFDPVDVDETPFMARVTDEDGYPGFRPYVDANVAFDHAAGVGISTKDPDMPEDEFAADDELAHRISQHEEAATDSVGAEVSDIAQMAQVSRMRHAELTVKAKYVRINPESAYRALLGSQRTMSTEFPEPVQVATWSADSDVETTAVTIQFLPVVNLSFDFVARREKPVRSYGVINFGTRGVYKAEVDIGPGVQLTLNASEVSLQVALEDMRTGPFATNDPAQLIIAGMLSFLPCVRTAPITRTKYFDFLDPLAATTIFIPPFAKKMIIYTNGRSTLNTIPFTYRVLNSTSRILLADSFAVGSSMTRSVLLPGSSFAVVIVNDDPVNQITDGLAVFELGL